MAVILPHKFKDGVGEVASGVQVLENDEALKAGIDALEAGSANSWTEAGAALSTPTVLNASRPGFVSFILEGNGGVYSGVIKINGKIVGKYNTAAIITSLGAFYVPKGQTWEIHHEAGTLAGANVSSVVL